MWWLYIVGPFVSLLPRRWRNELPFQQVVPWHFSSVVSGLAEFLIAVLALIVWYSYSVTHWVSRLMDNALSKAGPIEITDHEVGFAALLVVATHPFTWILLYFTAEGMARVCASFADTVLGTLPLYLLEKVHAKLRGVKNARPLGAPDFGQSNFASYVSTLHDKIAASQFPVLPDELCSSTVNAEEFLEIRASHAKEGWDPPLTVRYGDSYYRLEECGRGSAPRAFVYRLRRVSKGVPGRTVLVYKPDPEPVVAGRQS
jgi:hypothetical protein